jgi:hypothetical protein
MNDLLEQIEKALANNLYYLALQSTLALPDICSALISPNGQTSGRQYIDWYDRYAKEADSNAIDGEDCYKFRCSALHQGSSEHKKSSYSRILFVEPSVKGFVFHNNILNDSLNIDLNIFCNNMIESVRKWIDSVKNDSVFIENYKHFMKRHPNGLAPYIGGIPVIS